MALLAIDTCLGACSAAVVVEGRVAASTYEERRTGHAEAIVPMISAVIAKSRITTAEIRRIAVTRGPGTFAGMRIGLAAAEGLRLSNGASLIPVSSLWAIGQRVIAERASPVSALVVAVDAGRGQVYFELLGPDGRPSDGPKILSIEEAAQRTRLEKAVAVGSGAHLVSPAEFTASAPAIEPMASAFALPALDQPVATGQVAPLYFRPADAVVQAPPPGLR